MVTYQHITEPQKIVNGSKTISVLLSKKLDYQKEAEKLKNHSFQDVGGHISSITNKIAA